MAARAAARVGAELTTLVVPESALDVCAAAVASTMVQPMAGLPDLEHLLLDQRITSLLIGPGAEQSASTLATALTMLATHRALVRCTYVITVLGHDPMQLTRAIAGLCVVTPHGGELPRVFDQVLAAADDKLTRARAAARLCGAVVVLKGLNTVIAPPDGRAIVSSNAPATLARAGAGNVLAGMVVGLPSQGMAPF